MKDKWALLHGIPIYRFWEDDIRNNPSEVKKRLDEIIKIRKGEKLIQEKKNKRHNNRFNKIKT